MRISVLSALLLSTSFTSPAALATLVDTNLARKEAVIVYSSQKEHIINPLLERFTAETGIFTKLVFDNAGPLLERLKAEGSGTEADVLMAVDAGNLWLAASHDLLQPIESKTLKAAVPSHLRDPKGLWYGLSVRARTIVYNPAKVNAEELSSYEDLASPKWKGRLCLRSSQHVYNQSLVATMIEQVGEKKTAEVLKGWVANLATKPFGNDTQLLQAIEAGQCDVGISNSYYLARLMDEQPKTTVKLFWADQKSKGTHVNVFGAGLTKNAKRKESGQKLLEWLATEQGQKEIAKANFEFPVRTGIEPAAVVKNWGLFKSNTVNLSVAGKRQAEAVKLMDRVGYN
jgi:iron(III) transport system substrate-binding protein